MRLLLHEMIEVEGLGKRIMCMPLLCEHVVYSDGCKSRLRDLDY